MVYSILHILLLSCKMPPFWPGSVVVNDYATRKKKLSHAVEYGLIFHGTLTVKYYCKNMKYRINIYIYIYVCVQKKIVIERTRDLILPQICSDRLLPENN